VTEGAGIGVGAATGVPGMGAETVVAGVAEAAVAGVGVDPCG
jgi:hypothetical protein